MTLFASLIQKSIFLIVLGIMAQWIAWRVRFPAIVLLSIIGLLVGPIFGFLEPSKDFGQVMEVMIKLSVAVLLFEGGLNLKISELRQAGLGVGRLVLFGLPIAWMLGTACAYFIAGLSLPVSSIIGAILVVTGPTVIIPLLRQIKLLPKVTSLMKWEGVVNDPLGVLLAVFVFEYYIIATTSKSPLEIVLNIGSAVLVSLLIGVASGFFIKYTFQRRMCPEFLKVPIVLCFILLIYGVANIIQEEAGLLAVTAFGFTLCNVKLGIIHELRQFKEYISIFLLSTVFIALTASLNLEEQLYALNNWRSVAFLCAVLFVMRPVAVWLATVGGDLTWKERLLLGWIAPRGVIALSVAGLFAPTLIDRGYEGAEMLTPLVFAVVFITVVLHGLSLGTIARALGLVAKSPKGVLIVGASPWTTEFSMILKEHKIPVLLVDHAWHKLQEARSKNIPVFEGEILSSNANQYALNLEEMNYIISATDNDAYNALVCNAFKREFDYNHIFQFAMHKTADSNMIERTNRGHMLFGEHLKYEQILDRYFKGWRFQQILVDEKFKLDEFLETHKDKVSPLFIISENQKLILELPSKPLRPNQGDFLYCFIHPEHSL